MLDRRQFLVGASLGLLAAGCSPMTAVRRLLMVTGGSGGSFDPLPTFTTTALTTAPAGGNTWFNGPCAVNGSGKTYFGYLKGTNGDLCLRTVDDTTLSVSAERVVYPAFEIDDHDAPSILVRNSDGHICIAFALHVSDIYYGEGASAGALPPAIPDPAIRNITSSVGALSGGAGYTYAGIAQVSAVANTIYIFFRYHDSGGTAHLGYTKSTDNGATWGARVLVNTVTYHQFAVNGSDRIDFVCSPHATSDPGPHSIYHCYFVPSTEKWYQSDGTEITATKPFAATDMTLVYDGTSLPAWMWDIAIEPATGHPVITYATFPSTSDHRANYATWNGLAWTNHEIVSMGAYFPTAIVPGAGAIEDHYSGGVVLDRTDPRNVYISINTGSGRWDVYQYRTRDAGATWVSRALTSSGKNVRPVAVQGYHPSLQVMCMSGTYADYVSYSVATLGFGT